MENIIITNTIQEDEIIIGFNLQDGTVPFPPILMPISGDIELNPLVVKLTELIELKREIEFEYVDENDLIESNSKIKLVTETLDEMYNSFNSIIFDEDDLM